MSWQLGARALFIAGILLLFSATVAPAQHGEPDARRPPRSYVAKPIPAAEVGAWRDDLKTLVRELERLHPDPFTITPRSRFDSAATALDASISDLSALEIIVDIARLLALVGDGHTSLPLYFAHGVDFHVLPFRLGMYDDGVYVEAADRAYASLVGGRVVTIGGVPVEEAVARVTPLISRDNDNWISAVAPNLLNRIEVLHALGLAETLEGVDVDVRHHGELRSVRVEPLAELPTVSFGLPFLEDLTDDWVDARDEATAPIPLYQRNYDEMYWWEYLPEEDLLYIKWDQVQNRSEGPSALAVVREAMAFVGANRPSKTVIDIRNNTGGNGGLLPPIMREIVRTREIDEPGKLFLIIGRRTFSAGQMITSWLQQYSTAILVGEPSSARYNGYAGHVIASLPNSGITFMISPDYYQMGATPRDARQQATPLLAAVPTFDDYRSNRDPALDVILSYDPGAFTHDVMTAIASGDRARAADIVRDYDEQPVNRFHGSATTLNALGYQLLNDSRVKDAIAVFELNVEVHPQYANGWDSLGEAYVRVHRREDAVAAFRRALAIEPNLASSQAWLQKLGAGRR